jgi:hypothetical protein
MKPFKFFGNKQEYIETIPTPVEVTINRAIITSRVTTFVEFRYDRMFRQPERQYTYSGNTSFTRDNIRYHCVRTMDDVLGRHFDNYILLHDARDVEELEYIVTYLQNHGATEMF